MYRRYPEAYAEQVLGVQWWDKQRDIARALVEYKRVLVKASHSCGKSHCAASLVNWHFDCFRPSITISTAPTQSQVVDVLWKEVRSQRHGRPGLQPKAPRLETSADHFAVGYTARDDAAFQGRHAENVLIIFDECVGVDGTFWDAAEGMMTGPGCLWLAICNPTDTASRAYEEELKGKFHTISVSALEHPNIGAELRGETPPFPAAVRLQWVVDRIAEWCTQIISSDQRPGDLEFPPGSGQWYRPGPLFESRVLGRWPSQSANSVWSESAWTACMAAKPEPNAPPVIGCDVARFGSDYTSIVVRKGDCVTHHETHNGWSTDETAARLKELCRIHADGVEPRSVEVHVDADGIGAGVLDQAEGFRFIGARGSSRANSPDAYPNRRSEAWFSLAERARDGRLDLSRLSPESRSLLRRQAMAPEWKVDSQGRRVVEPKADTKRRLGRSPDDMDALNLAFTSAPEIEILWLGGTPGSSSEVHVDGEHESDYTDWLCPYCGGDPQGMRAVARYRPCAVDEAPGRPVHCAICYERCPSVRGAHNVTGWWRRSED